MPHAHFKPRKHLSGDALIRLVRSEFEHLPDATSHASAISLTDALMSGFALFALKDPSLLAFQERRNDDNLRSIYHIQQVPSDTYLRTLLDDVEPQQLAPAFRAVFRQLQRGKALLPLQLFPGHYLLLLDGVEYFRSTKVHCDKCLEHHHRNGTVSYHHQLLGAVLAHPDHAEVIPLQPEPIQKQDGQQKNDCERNAAKRLLQRIAREHPHLRFVVAEDALSANGPHIELLHELGMHYILGVKPGDHAPLFQRIEEAYQAGQTATATVVDEERNVLQHYRYLSQVPLNDTHPDLLVNVLEYWEVGPQGIQYFSWVTDLELRCDTVEMIMRAGRARWKIENETFNTLKNQGYHFEHNYGHGEKNLSVVFALLMMLAFLVDQLQQLGDDLFRAVWHKLGSKRALWDRIRSLFRELVLTSWRDLLETLYYGHAKQRPVRVDDS